MAQFKSTRGADLADLGQILAQRPDIYYVIAWARLLNREYRSGRLSLPAQIDLSDLDTDSAELAAAFISAVTGGGL